MRRRYRSRYESSWPAYVPVAERRAMAKRNLDKLRKKGEPIQPVVVEGRTIARTFWGKAWCDHLESFGDYSNRLPRGRSYVRNGSVCHLEMARGRVEARVAGSSLYNVRVEIKPLAARKWKALKVQCAGRIGSLIELLQGKLSDEIMGAVTDRQKGLFPLTGEIAYTCDCPDWADMCKHVSAVMYGIGARLDEQPELLFLLRGVNHDDLVSGETAAATVLAGDGSHRSRRRALSESEAAKMFGVELDEAEAPPIAASPVPKPPETPKTKLRRSSSKKKTAKAKSSSSARASFTPTGAAVTKLRKRLALSRAAFARVVGVSATTVAKWEKSRGALQLHAKGLRGLRRLHVNCSGKK